MILISIDALRRDHLGTYGYARDTSPWIDGLAERSIVFERAYTAAAWTLISHMSMLTGLYPEQHGVVGDGLRLADEIPTLAERLAARGYHTAALYREGWIHERFGFDRGFHVVRHHEDAAGMARHARELLEQRPRDKPLFLFLHAWDVHSARMTEASGRAVYDPPPGYDDRWIPGARARLEGVIHPVRLYKGRDRPTPEQREALVALYDGNIRYVDDVLAGLAADWRDHGLLDHALVMLTSDHGEALAQRPGEGGHGGFREEGIAVPLVVRLPDGAGAGTRRDDLVSLVDLVPTVLAALGVEREPWLAGRPLQAPPERDRAILVQRPPKSAVLLGPWKFWWRETQDPRRGQLHHLGEDPGERAPITWVADRERFDKALGLLAAARDRLRASWAPVPGQARVGAVGDPEELELLRQLGYLGDDDG